MNKNTLMKSSITLIRILFFLLLTAGLMECQIEKKRSTSTDLTPEFTFVFMTDIHVQPENRAMEGFKKAIDTVNKINPDFVITGGDLIMDALGVGFSRADSLYKIYEDLSAGFNMPVYNTMGNHEVFGIYKRSGVDSTHMEYGEKMFMNRIGKRYYSFDHKGWHFLILDSVEEIEEEDRYIGEIDREQMEWIAKDLEEIDKATPVCVSVHIPFITVTTQLMEGSLTPNSEGLVIGNSKEVLDLFSEYNLRLVLQGHLHYLEDIFADNTHFITGGAVCAGWWHGPFHGTEEGFLVVKVQGEDIEWEYVDYGWEVPVD